MSKNTTIALHSLAALHLRADFTAYSAVDVADAYSLDAPEMIAQGSHYSAAAGISTYSLARAAPRTRRF